MRCFCKMTIRGFLLPTATLLALVGLTRTAPAADDGWRAPLSSRNQFPLALAFLQLRPERATVLRQSDTALVFNFDYSNVITFQSTQGESLLLDAEYLRVETRFELGLGRGLEIAAEVPFYVLYGGFLDPFVSDFHRALGLPNATREAIPNNRFSYVYQVDGSSIVDRREPTQAIGDISLELKKAVSGVGPWELALRGAWKLPTGSVDNLTGSGKSDFGAGVALSRVGGRFGGYFNLSYHLLGKPEGLKANNYYSLMGALDWRLRSHMAAVFQYEQSAPFVRSELPVLGQTARQLVLGLRWRRSETNRFEWRFVEDLSSTAPDFTFAFQWALHWAKGGS